MNPAEAHMNPEYSHFSTTGLANALPSTEAASSQLDASPSSCSSEPGSPVIDHPDMHYQSSSAPHRMRGRGLTRNQDSNAFGGRAAGHYRVPSASADQEELPLPRTRSQRANAPRSGSMGCNRSLSPLPRPAATNVHHHHHHHYHPSSATATASDAPAATTSDSGNGTVATIELPIAGASRSSHRSERTFDKTLSSSSLYGSNSTHLVSRTLSAKRSWPQFVRLAENYASASSSVGTFVFTLDGWCIGYCDGHRCCHDRCSP